MNKSNNIHPIYKLITTSIFMASSHLAFASVSNVKDANTYCNSEGGGSHEWISNVKLNNLSYSSGQEAYSDNTDKTANLTSGHNSITLTPGFRSKSYDEHWAVYIDYNQDGDFDDTGEQVVTGNSHNALQIPFNVPTSVHGVTTRMRVAMRYYNPVSSACNNISAGEIEDYTVSISNIDTSPETGDMPNACESQTPFTGRDLFDGQTICLDSGRQTFNIANSDNYTTIAISTSHGTGNITLFAKNGERPKTDYTDPYSRHVGNNECIIINTPSEYWSYLEVNGTHENTSLVVDFNATACRVEVGETEEIKDNYGNDGYTDSSVNIKVFRIEFSDTPFDWNTNDMNTEFNKMVDFYKRSSYGQFDVTYDMSHPVINIDKPITYYEGQSSNQWHADWQAKVLAATGINAKSPGDKTVILVTAPKPNGYNSTAEAPYISLFHQDGGVLAHELGHAMGIRHAYGLEGESQIIGAGVDKETESINYGGLFSLMGKGSREYMDFDLMHKSYMGWLKPNDVPVITQSGIYRIYALDHGNSTGHNTPGNIGLRLQSGNTESDHTYWLEYRTTNHKYGNDIDNGVLVYLQGMLEKEQNPKYWQHTSHLLDMTPNSQSSADWWGQDFTDSELALGKSYSDKWGAFTIKVLNKGGELGTPNAWMDISVTLH
ncbi:hypothetical protein KO527_00235 [Pseudoalteromonas sp. C2R02]|uniref:GEVED domain-containing protein n=1 Tax=Pseudoalteromonas sp. C2R02 TaxID=2841565 RepID=UPI001C09DD79|nr:GEVED domain-containing protein [Pseudoalteromonas sp. C2R02]MBU2967791.1 hypothetical protein [Pseudoalteromonas sp. C2R02]